MTTTRTSRRSAHKPRRTPVPPPRLLTYDDYLKFPDDRNRYELIDGELHVSPAPKRSHQDIVGNLYLALAAWVRSNNIGHVMIAPVDYKIDERTIVQPDLLWLPASHPQYRDRDSMLSAPPGLVIEILSPGRASYDLKTKFAAYQRAGVPCYWIADYDREIMEAWELKHGTYVSSYKMRGRTFSAPPFARLAINLGAIFAPPK